MWLFLATEVMFFGDLFMAYTVYHIIYPSSFGIGGQNTNLLLGSINTLILLVSGLTMVLAVAAIQKGNSKTCQRLLWLTTLLAVAFLFVKGLEYADDIHKQLIPTRSHALAGRPASDMFLYLYWVMTAVHALHVVVGAGILAALAFLTSRNRYSAEYHTPVELGALYWGFVDIIWMILFPLLYLIDRHGHL